MLRIRNYFSTILLSMCSALLTLLGFTQCKKEIPLMYGSPTSDFEIKGTVTTEEGRAVEGAEIRVTGSDEPSGYYTFSTTATNKYGEYFTYGEGHGWSSMKVVCIPEDDDLEPDSVIIKMNYVGKDGWYWGLAKETVNFTLKKKE